MINFRFHLVSLIAVFLALALGVVVGSTVIDRAIVDGLEAQIDRVERNAETQRRENGELRQDVEQLSVLAEQVAPFAVERRLDGVPIVVMAVRGIDENAVRSAIESIRVAGGEAPSIVWLEPGWALVESDGLASFRELLDRPRAGAEALREMALDRVVDRLAAGSFAAQRGDVVAEQEAPPTDVTTTSATGPSPGETTTTTAPPPDVDILAALVDAGFASFDAAGAEPTDIAAYPGAGARVVVLDGAEARVSADSLFLPLIESLAEYPLLTLAAEVPGSGDEAEPAAVVGRIRRDDERSGQVSTVDGVGTVRGRMALVLALEELGRGEVGHYGLGPGASRQLPEPARS